MNTQKGNGTVIGIVIVILILALGGWYVWHSRNSAVGTDTIETETNNDTSASSTEQSLNTQSNSDDIGSIETDLNATSYDNL